MGCVLKKSDPDLAPLHVHKDIKPVLPGLISDRICLISAYLECLFRDRLYSVVSVYTELSLGLSSLAQQGHFCLIK